MIGVGMDAMNGSAVAIVQIEIGMRGRSSDRVQGSERGSIFKSMREGVIWWGMYRVRGCGSRRRGNWVVQSWRCMIDWVDRGSSKATRKRLFGIDELGCIKARWGSEGRSAGRAIGSIEFGHDGIKKLGADVPGSEHALTAFITSNTVNEVGICQVIDKYINFSGVVERGGVIGNKSSEL